LTATAIAAAFLSPVQDHIRRMLHVGGNSRGAALVSTVQLGAVVALLVGGTLLDVDRWWLPFGALAVAKLVSTIAGVGWSRRELASVPSTPLHGAEVWQLGRWLMLITLLDAGSAFVGVALVATIAGTAAVGYAEAARVAAHPVMVLAWGLSGVLGPRAVRAGRALDPEAGRYITRTFVSLLGTAGAVCLILFGVQWIGNPMAWLLPVAYVVPGLVATSILAHIALGAPYMARSELIGGQRGAPMAKVDLAAALLRVLVAGSAGLLHSHAVPASLFGSGIAQWVGYRRLLRTMYGPTRGGDALRVEAQHAGS
jgi:O-antigen/teichoic acid export membrane protein